MGSIQWLEFELFKKFSALRHGVFLRHGGSSQGAFDSLNVSNSVGDRPSCVSQNRELVRDSLSLGALVFPNQEHGRTVLRATKGNMAGVFHADGLVCNEVGIGLAISHADCQVALFYDPVKKAIGAAHAGWKGSVQNIYASLIEAMHREFDTEPRDLRVGISPSLGPDHAEFKNYRQELPPSFWDYQTTSQYFDFWAISKWQLTECGVLEQNIEISGLCTYCNEDDFFSYRRDKSTGRNVSVIGIGIN